MKRRGRLPARGLTARELEVLDLLRDGLTNREIAERLGISLAGAKFHVSEIISKLGVSGREEAALWRERLSGVAPLLALWRRLYVPRTAAVAGAATATLVLLLFLALISARREQ